MYEAIYLCEMKLSPFFSFCMSSQMFKGRCNFLISITKETRNISGNAILTFVWRPEEFQSETFHAFFPPQGLSCLQFCEKTAEATLLYSHYLYHE